MKRQKPPELDPPVSRKRVLSEEEKRLWQQAVLEEPGLIYEEADVILSAPAPPVARLKKKPAAKKPSAPVQTTTPASMATEAYCDLHGHTLKTAYSALSRFIMTAHAQQLQKLLVITGKGKTEGNSTIRAMFPYWLQETELSRYVSSFSHASLKHGGSGAWYVRIRRQPL